MQRRTLWMVFLLLTSASVLGAKPDPSHYINWLGPETCAECHEDEATIWRHAHHATSFKEMPSSEEGKQIASTLGIKRIKMSQECGACHVSYKIKKGGKRLRAIAGVSCESCHGPAKNWNIVHQDYGGKHVSAEQESESHKAQRWAQAEKAGMRRPLRQYNIFKQCFGCHTVPDEALINKTKHPTGHEFELVKWSNGEVRHNVWYSKGRANKIRPPHQQRMRYIMGQTLALEFSLRGLAGASSAGKYAKTMTERAKSAIANLQQINGKLSIPEITDVLSIAKQTELSYQQKEKLISAADKISALNQKFIDEHDGKAFKEIDAMLPTKYKGEPKR